MIDCQRVRHNVPALEKEDRERKAAWVITVLGLNRYSALLEESSR